MLKPEYSELSKFKYNSDFYLGMRDYFEATIADQKLSWHETTGSDFMEEETRPVEPLLKRRDHVHGSLPLNDVTNQRLGISTSSPMKIKLSVV